MGKFCFIKSHILPSTQHFDMDLSSKKRYWAQVGPSPQQCMLKCPLDGHRQMHLRSAADRHTDTPAHAFAPSCGVQPHADVDKPATKSRDKIPSTPRSNAETISPAHGLIGISHQLLCSLTIPPEQTFGFWDLNCNSVQSLPRSHFQYWALQVRTQLRNPILGEVAWELSGLLPALGCNLLSWSHLMWWCWWLSDPTHLCPSSTTLFSQGPSHLRLNHAEAELLTFMYQISPLYGIYCCGKHPDMYTNNL